MKRAACRTAGLLMLLALPLSGGAFDLSSFVKLTFEGCTAVSVDEVDRILDLELRSIAAGHRELTARPIRVTVSCAPGGISLAATCQTVERFSNRPIPLGEHPPEGTERVIAIAVAELALSTWEPRFADTDAASPSSKERDEPISRSSSTAKTDSMKSASDSTSESAPDAGDEKRFGAALRVSALWRMYINGKTNLFGGELGGDLNFPRLFRMRLCIVPEGGRTDRPLGKASLFSLSAALSVGIHARVFSSPLEGGVDIGFRGGYGRLRGRPKSPPSTGDSLSGAFGGPLLRLSLASATRPAVGLSVEMGYAVFGITGSVDVGSPVVVKGLWISVLLDCSLSLRRKSRGSLP